MRPFVPAYRNYIPDKNKLVLPWDDWAECDGLLMIRTNELQGEASAWVITVQHDT